MSTSKDQSDIEHTDNDTNDARHETDETIPGTEPADPGSDKSNGITAQEKDFYEGAGSDPETGEGENASEGTRQDGGDGTDNLTTADILTDVTDDKSDAAENPQTFDAAEVRQDMAAQSGVATAGASGSGQQAVPGGVFGLIVLLLVASVIGGLIVTLWPGADRGGPAATLPDGFENRLSGAETRVGDLEQQLAETRNRTRAMENFMQSDEGAAIPGETINVLEELQNRVDGLEEAVAGLKASRPAPGGQAAGAEPDFAPALNSLSQDLAALKADLTGRLEQLEQNAPPGDLQQQLESLASAKALESLTGRVAAIENDNTGSEAKQAALALALANFSRAVQTEQPYAAELQAVRMLAPQIDYPDLVLAHADTGVPTQEDLKTRFSDLAFEALRAENAAGTTGFFGQLQANFDNVFSIRRTGDIQGEGTDATLARAENRLKGDDFQGAVEELNRLNDQAAEIVRPWQENVTARLQLESFLVRLNQSVVERLGQD